MSPAGRQNGACAPLALDRVVLAVQLAQNIPMLFEPRGEFKVMPGVVPLGKFQPPPDRRLGLFVPAKS
jgi:hypothetical protein